ncbi:hypothetical protein KM043_014174 [Ampulex compressa]|nr:hypothetical protein KM043_014174 [Ampulex compressa]
MEQLKTITQIAKAYLSTARSSQKQTSDYRKQRKRHWRDVVNAVVRPRGHRSPNEKHIDGRSARSVHRHILTTADRMIQHSLVPSFPRFRSLLKRNIVPSCTIEGAIVEHCRKSGETHRSVL